MNESASAVTEALRKEIDRIGLDEHPFGGLVISCTRPKGAPPHIFIQGHMSAYNAQQLTEALAKLPGQGAPTPRTATTVHRQDLEKTISRD